MTVFETHLVLIPSLWRYLISHFLKISFSCVLAFVAILLTMRLDEIAHFAALGAPVHYLLYFSLYQIPYILPIALPLSCLIASLVLIQRLSNSQELTALRASGFSLRDILAPILLTASFLSIANFFLTSEIATQSHFQTNKLKNELRSVNPLLLLQNKHLMRLKGFYFETMGSSHVGESASDVILVMPNKSQKRLSLMLAKHLKTGSGNFIGEGVTFITGSPSKKEDDFDHLFIENIGSSITQTQNFSHLLQNKVWTVNNDYLQLSILLSRIQGQKKALHESLLKNEPQSQIKNLKMQLNRSYSEVIKRFSIAIAVLTFTFMGTAFGINISRRRRYLTIYLAIALTTFFLISFFVAKGLDQYFWTATALFLFPHLLICFTSLYVLKRISRGME